VTYAKVAHGAAGFAFIFFETTTSIVGTKPGRGQSRMLRTPRASSIHFSSKYSSVPSPSRGDCPGNSSVIGLSKRVYQGFFDMIAAAAHMKND
jgi:hypothetical protein